MSGKGNQNNSGASGPTSSERRQAIVAQTLALEPIGRENGKPPRPRPSLTQAPATVLDGLIIVWFGCFQPDREGNVRNKAKGTYERRGRVRRFAAWHWGGRGQFCSNPRIPAASAAGRPQVNARLVLVLAVTHPP